MALGDEIKVTPFHSSKVLKQQCAGKCLTGFQKEKKRWGKRKKKEEEKKDDALICSLCKFP